MHQGLKLANTSVLWTTFIATILLTLSFVLLSSLFELTLIDGISAPEQVRTAIANMTQQQRTIHAWITGTVDVAYPISYGLLFAGSAFKFFPKGGWLLAMPGLLAIPVDLAEGVVQILALTDQIDWVSSKALLTPFKTALFFTGFLVTLCGWTKWSYLRLVHRSSSSVV